MIHEISKPATLDYPQAMNCHIDYCRHQAPTYIENFAISSYFAIIANACGQKFLTPTRMPLNMYITNLAFSTSGKGFYHNLIRRVFGHEELDLGHMLGYENPSSGNALYKHLMESPVLICPMDEIGKVILSTQQKNGPLSTVMRAWLSLYDQGTEKDAKQAYYVDKDKDRIAAQYPCFSIYGSTNPSVFWDSMNDREVLEGFLGRMFVLDKGNAKYELNKSCRRYHKYDDEIIRLIKNITEAKCFNQPIDIDQEADAMLDQYMESVFAITNRFPSHVATPTLNRSIAMGWKIASILAISDDMANTNIPEVTIREKHARVGLYFAKKSADLCIQGLGYGLREEKIVLANSSQVESSQYEKTKKQMIERFQFSDGLTFRQISRTTPGRYLSYNQRKDLLQDLIESQIVEMVDDRKGDAIVTVYRLIAGK